MSVDPLTRSTTADPALAIAVLAPDVRAQRDADAVAYLTRTGNADLIDVLGLGDSVNAAGGPLSRACPVCGAAAGARCENQDRSGMARRFHRARSRVADVPD